MNKKHFERYPDKHTPHPKKHIRRTEHVEVQLEDDRTGMSLEALKRALADNLYYILGKDKDWATPHDYFMALAYNVRDRLLHRWLKTVEQTYFQKDVKVVCYLSAEYLIGRQLGKNLVNAGFYEQARQVVRESGFDAVHPPAVSTSLSFALRAGNENNLVLFALAVIPTARAGCA
jgi:starch phosphorylase